MTGLGKVYKDSEFVAIVRYEYRIITRHERGGSFDGFYAGTGVARVSLRINPALNTRDGLLTLHMNDGKKLDFYVESSDGACQCTGAPY
jgi:hypothetical protein